MGYHLRHVVLATGTKVSTRTGAPNITDIAVAITRIPRFSGNGILWFPVGLHCFVVCDLLPDRLKVYGLIHDGPEVVGNDLPKPMKPAIVEHRENRIHVRTVAALGLPPLSVEDEVIVKAADTKALYAEIFTAGPIHLRPEYMHVQRDPAVERLIYFYYGKFPPAVCTQYGGPAAAAFIAKYIEYRALLPAQGNHANTAAPAANPDGK